jgi:hypothetical protein
MRASGNPPAHEALPGQLAGVPTPPLDIARVIEVTQAMESNSGIDGIRTMPAWVGWLNWTYSSTAREELEDC